MTNQPGVRILNPVGVVLEEEVPDAGPIPVVRLGRRAHLEGATLGVLTNVFRGYDIPGTVAERIHERGLVHGVLRMAKPSISRPAGEVRWDELVAAGIDAAVVGLGG